MYNDYFGFREAPFSIAPDPRYLLMTDQHREALAHLVYGLNSDGGIILLTGEVGTGKTTVCRALLAQIPEAARVALVLNPKLTAAELLASVCDELHIERPHDASIKTCTDLLNRFLLDSHARGEKTVLIIDEAQNLDNSVLEQLRLLTNLETDRQKLLQIILLGQPELLDMLSSEAMRQLAQRITARFHLKPLSREDIKAYVDHRLAVAGQTVQLFPPASIKRLYRLSRGIPRLINILCDRALLGAYVQNRPNVDPQTLEQAAREVFGEIKTVTRVRRRGQRPLWYALAALVVFGAVAGGLYFEPDTSVQTRVTHSAAAQTDNATVIQSARAALPAASAPPPQPAAAKPQARLTDKPPTGLPAELFGTAGREAVDAYSHLFRLWGKSYDANSGVSACGQAQQAGLACLHKTGNLNSLRRSNRPAVLKLYDLQGNAVFTTLSGLDGNSVTLRAGDETLRLDATTLDRHWLGEYTLLWQPPPFYRKALTPGSEGPLVQWLDQQMVRLDDGDSDFSGADAGIRNRYDDALVARVKRFQREHGLVPDGIAGPLTFIHLNNALHGGAPTLSHNEAG